MYCLFSFCFPCCSKQNSFLFLYFIIYSNIVQTRFYEAEFMNVQFRWGFWAYSLEFSDLRFSVYKVYILPNHFCSRIKSVGRSDWKIARRKTLKTFVPITSKNSASVFLPLPLFSLAINCLSLCVISHFYYFFIVNCSLPQNRIFLTLYSEHLIIYAHMQRWAPLLRRVTVTLLTLSRQNKL